MARLTGNRSLYDPPPEETENESPLDAWARSPERKGSVTWKQHQQQIESVINAVQSGQISQEGAINLAQRVKGLAPFILPAIESRKSASESRKLIGQYVNPGRPETPFIPSDAGAFPESDQQLIDAQMNRNTGRFGLVESPAIPAKRDYQGLVDEFVSRGQLDAAEQFKKIGGLDKTAHNRGQYWIPQQTAKGIWMANTRWTPGSDELPGFYATDSKGNPVVGTSSDPTAQGAIAGAKAHGAAVGKDVASAGNLADSEVAISNASKILDKGIYSGAWGPTQKELVKRFPGADKTTASNTEEFISYVGNVVIPMMKDLGGSDTVEELNYMKSLVAGDITMEKSAIRNVLAETKKKIEARQARLKAQAKTVGLEGKSNAALKEREPNRPFTDEEYEATRRRILGR